MSDYIEIDTAPKNEPCVQVTDRHPYMIKMRQEAIRFIEFLKNRFENFDKAGGLLPHSYHIRASIRNLDAWLIYGCGADFYVILHGFMFSFMYCTVWRRVPYL